MQPLSPDIVRAAIRGSGIQKSEIAERAGVNKNTMTAIESDGWNPKWETMRALWFAVLEIQQERDRAPRTMNAGR